MVNDHYQVLFFVMATPVPSAGATGPRCAGSTLRFDRQTHTDEHRLFLSADSQTKQCKPSHPGGQALQRRTSPPEADKPSALLIKIRSVVLVFFVRVGLCGLAGSTCLGEATAKTEASCEAWSVANFIFKLCVADIIYCICKDADADCGSWIDFSFFAFCFFFIARPVRMVGKMIVGFRVGHKTENPA